MMKILKTLIISILAASTFGHFGFAYAVEGGLIMLDLQTYKACELNQSGWGGIKNPFRKTGRIYADGCIVNFSKEEFDKNFKFCYLAKVGGFHNWQSNCGIHYGAMDKSYAEFFAHSGDSNIPSCSFVCQTK